MERMFARNKKRIQGFIKKFLSVKRREFIGKSKLGADATRKLAEFSTQGKALRGSLVLHTAEIFGKKTNQEILKTAVALELIHSALLIHDDIIDKDNIRRGKPAMHIQYKYLGNLHIGKSMAICVADLGFFLAFELLFGLKIASKTKERIGRIICDKLGTTAAGQMDDIYMGHTRKASAGRVLAIYCLKTAEYSFVMPLLVGFEFAKEKHKKGIVLNRLGTKLGIIFQLTDDLIDNDSILVKKLGRRKIEKKIDELENKTEKLIAASRFSQKQRKFFGSLLSYCVTRKF